MGVNTRSHTAAPPPCSLDPLPWFCQHLPAPDHRRRAAVHTCSPPFTLAQREAWLSSYVSRGQLGRGRGPARTLCAKMTSKFFTASLYNGDELVLCWKRAIVILSNCHTHFLAATATLTIETSYSTTDPPLRRHRTSHGRHTRLLPDRRLPLLSLKRR